MKLSGAGPSLAVISAIITPVFLVLASAALLNATLTRLARITDRARLIIEFVRADRAAGDTAAADLHTSWLNQYTRRSRMAEYALLLFLCAIGCFIAASLAIGLESLLHEDAPWVAVALVVVGATLLLVATSFLLRETLIATGTLRAEIRNLCDSVSVDRKAEPGAPAARAARAR